VLEAAQNAYQNAYQKGLMWINLEPVFVLSTSVNQLLRPRGSSAITGWEQSCQMVCFQTKNPNLVKIWRDFVWKMLLYFMTIWNIFRPFGIIYGLLAYVVCGHLVYFFTFWYVWTKKNLATLAERSAPSFKAWPSMYFIIHCFSINNDYVPERLLLNLSLETTFM
jgi:hypothetical protein